MERSSWLLLLYALPTRRATARVNLWRKLKKFGAVSLKTSAYVLPDQPAHHERFQWLATQIRDEGGDATLIRVAEIEGLPPEQLVEMFNSARAADYKELMASIHETLDRIKKSRSAAVLDQLVRHQSRLNEIKEIDYFNAPAGHDAQMLLEKAERFVAPRISASSARTLRSAEFQKKLWLTRPKPGIDRIGSAWLIRNFIDPHAEFVFGMEVRKFPNALPFDMADAEFSHHGDDCTFETLLKRFAVENHGLRIIGEMIHDADLEDRKFGRVECIGLNFVFEGWARMGLSDDELITRGLPCFDALYEKVKK
ncbi:MAG TPA: chromate resistance protein ChrB domain-containing protein [Verrucomicrobiae bacterium]|jgi:hypothetical protein|nr:chromate resistance protein ChrB domain-containing protein [Verrucomicrobiae bacterium]